MKHITPAATKVTYDFPKILKKLTGKGGWKEFQGLDSGVGIDYWYSSGDSEALINIDKIFMTISVDGEVVFAGDADVMVER